MNFNDEEIVDLFYRLLERLQQADGENTKGSHNTIIYVASGATYVNNQHNQNFQPDPPRKKEPPTSGDSASPSFNPDTPLSALFRENHHKELRQIIDSWRPYLIGDDLSIDALALSNFQFDFEKVIAAHIYIDIGRLLYDHALKDDNMSLLAKYLFQHSNLSNSESTLYAQLRKYKKR